MTVANVEASADSDVRKPLERGFKELTRGAALCVELLERDSRFGTIDGAPKSVKIDAIRQYVTEPGLIPPQSYNTEALVDLKRNVVDLLELLGEFYTREDEWVHAERSWRLLFEVQSVLFGSNSSGAIWSARNVGEALKGQGKIDELRAFAALVNAPDGKYKM